MRAESARPPRTPARRRGKSFGSLNLSSFSTFVSNLPVKYKSHLKVAQGGTAAPPVLEQWLLPQFQI
jgi:hypothetical protein